MLTITNEDNINMYNRIEDNSICLSVSSPPYNLGEKHHTGSKIFSAYDGYVDDIPEDKYQEQQIILLNEAYRTTKNGGSFFYNHKNRIKKGFQISPYSWIFKTNWQIKQELVWFNGSQNFDKVRFYPMTERIYWLTKGVEKGFENKINQHDLIKDIPEGTNKYHKRSFPLSLAERFISCFPNSKLICDPYLGSGTTAIASINQNKDFIGCEISKDYYDAAMKRIDQHIRTNTKLSFDKPKENNLEQGSLF